MPIIFASPLAVQGWNVLKIGNGGFIKSLSVATDGSMVATTDTMGGYVWNSTQNQWVQILNASTMPAGTTNTGGLDNPVNSGAQGIDYIGMDPTNPNNIWMQWIGNVYKSIDKGVTFTTTTFPTQTQNVCNTSIQGWTSPVAIDPNNSSVVYIGTPNQGCYVTTDGTTWNQVATVSAALPANIPNTAGSPKAGTSTTSHNIATGNPVSFTTNTAFGFGTGGWVTAWQTSNPANQLYGSVNSNAGTNLSLNVTATQGSGAGITDWSFTSQNALGGGHRIAFDISAGTTVVGGQTRTANIFIHTYNVGIWKSIDGGVSFSPVTSSNRPNALRHMRCDPFGVLWCLDDDFPGTNSNVDKYDGTTWTAHINTSGGSNVWWDGIAIDTANSGSKATTRIAVCSGNSLTVQMSVDGGAGWNPTSGGDTAHRSFASSGDVDWIQGYFSTLNSGAGFFFGCNDMAFDPTHSGRLYVAAEGVWYGIPGTSSAATNTLAMTQQTRGIEEFIANKIISPNTNTVLTGLWDFPGFYKSSGNFATYPSALNYQPGNAQTGLQRGYGIDWLYSNPNTVVNIVEDGRFGNNASSMNFSGISTDGGQNWTKFSTVLSDAAFAGGDIAIGSSSTYVWLQPNNTVPKETTTSGSSWNAISLSSGATPTSFWGVVFAFGTQYCKYMDSDKANGDIYIYNVSVNGGVDGFFRRVQSTGIWTQRAVSLGVGSISNLNGQMKSVGVAGHLFFTPGIQAAPHPASTSFYFTTDGWATSGTVSGFSEVQTFGYGATFASYPTLFAVGWRSGVYGIWMCKDFNSGTGVGTWTRCLDSGGSPYPLGILSNICDMDGDKSIPGKVYIATNGGFFWGQFS